MKVIVAAFIASSLILAPALAQSGGALPDNPATGTSSLPTSGTQNGLGSPTGTGIGTGGNSTLVAPGAGGNGFQNNTSLNGSSSSGTLPGGGAATGTAP